MIYVFDTSPFIIIFRYYYHDRFPTFWNNFDAMIAGGKITSVREVRNELLDQDDKVGGWAKGNISTFPIATKEEINFVKKIFEQPHFRGLIGKQQQLKGKPVADPFVIAKAATIQNGCVVTAEKYKEKGAKIPNVCEHFDVPCMNLEEFMAQESWEF